MKQVVIYICEIVLCAFLVCFCVLMLFQREENKGFMDLAENFAKSCPSKEIISENEQRLKQILNASIPEIKLEKESYKMGEEIVFEFLQRSNPMEVWTSITGNSVEILDIRNNIGNSVRNEFLAEGNILHERGKYRVIVKVTSMDGKNAEKVFPFLVR